MGVMLQVSFFKLIVISLLAFDLAVQGSGEQDISPSPDISSAIPPIQGTMGPANQENSPISDDWSPKPQNGSTVPPPLASPPVISSPLAPTIKGSNLSPSPSVSTPLLLPPVASPLPAPPIKGLEPSLSPSALTPLPPHIVAPPPVQRHTASPPAGASPPQKAPVIVASGVPPAQGPVLSTPFGDVPQHSPVTKPIVPPPLPSIANSKNESRVNAPAQEPRAQAPVASPESGVSQNSSPSNPLPPAKAPSVIADTGRSPASAPPQKRNHMPFALPPSPTLSTLPPLNHSPTKGASHSMAPSKHSDTASAPPLPSHHHKWSYSPASSPSSSFHRNHYAGKVIPPVANPPSKAPSMKKAVTPSGNASAPYSSSSPSEGYSPTSPPSGSVHKHHYSRKPALSPTPGSFHVDISPTPTWQGPVVPPVILPRNMGGHNASPPLYPVPPISPSHFPVPSPIGNTSPSPSPIGNTSPSPSPIGNTSPSPSPSPSPTAKSGNAKAPPANASPSSPKIPLLPPFHAFPPPPPNEDCSSTVCSDPLTNTPPGAPCGCVQPMQVGLRLGVDLYTFFPLVSEFAAEVASGVFMKQSQVRIMGANAAPEQPEKTVVLLDLVPLGQHFDNTTAFLTFERIWHKQIAINASSFGDYDVLYVHYPGLPPSPPLPPSEAGIIDDGPYSGNNNNARTNKPFGVDVRGRQHKHGLSGGVIAIIALSILVAVVLCSVAAWVLLLKHREHVSQAAPAPQTLLPSMAKSSGIGGSILGSGPSSASLSFGSSIATYTGSAKTYGASDIERATNNFDSSRILGEGGFGRVYSGVLDRGTKVAVKVLKRDDQQGGREFLAEVEMLSRLHHRNLVKLMGICTEERARCLVYELIPNGSVESHLHGVDKETAPLDWPARMKIALGAARGLAYLHEDSSPRVIHRDFKSSNILLEQDFTPKVSDFGLARTALDEENRHISTRVMGTFGYVAPEYAMTGHLLVKSDVYSYGVVLLELLTGRKPVDMTQPPGQENLVAWARPLLTSKEGLEMIVDPSLGPDVPFDSVAKVAAIASMCVQPEVSHRPFMGEVVQALKLVCNECEEARGVGSRSSSRDDLSIDLEGRASSASGQLPNPLHCQYSESNFASGINTERGLSVSELLSTSAGYERQVSGSFRRHSSSGPLRTGRGPHFWQRFRRLSGGSVSEHGAFLKLWPGSQ